MLNRTEHRVDTTAQRRGLCTLVAAAIAALALTAVLASAASAAALTDADELGRFGSEGEGAGQLAYPGQSVADSVTGHLYVVDNGNRRISEFTPWGEFVMAFGADVAPGAVNEQQEVRVRAGAGTFNLTFGANTTADLPFDATAAEVQSALDGLASIEGAGGSVAVEEALGKPATATPYIFVVTFKGSLAGTDVAQLGTADGATPLSAGNPETELEVRTRTDGTPGSSGLESCTAESGCRAGRLGKAGGVLGEPRQIVSDAAGDLYVGEEERVQKFTPRGHFLWAIGGDTITGGAAGSGIVSPGSSVITSVVTTEKAFRVDQVIEGVGIEADTTIAALGADTITLSAPAGPAATGTTTNLTVAPGPNNVPSNETQTVTLGSKTTGGDFKLIFRTLDPSPSLTTTAAIPAGATAAELQEKLVALANIGAGNVAVTGPAGGPWTVEFKGARYADTQVPQFDTGTGETQLSETLAGLTTSSGNPEITISPTKGEEICRAAAECQVPEYGNTLRFIRESASAHTRSQTGNGVAGLVAPAPGGGIYAATGNLIRRYDAEGKFQSQITAPSYDSHSVIAVDSKSGAIYQLVANSTGGGADIEAHIAVLDPTSAAEVGRLELERPKGGLAIDPAGDVFVTAQAAFNGDKEGSNSGPHERVVEFDAKGNRISTLAEVEPVPGSSSTGIFSLAGIGTNFLGDLYVANHQSSSHSGAFIRIFGPPPISFESPPKVAPQITTQYAASVGLTEAELRAKINPHFWNDTSYHVEYGSSPCSEGGCESTPEVKLSSKVSGSPLLSHDVLLEGLERGATYHYRFVAKSAGGGPAYGPDVTFTTFRAPAEQGCPENEAFRTGISASLPDCRAYEMVSPVNKEGGDVVVQPSCCEGVPAALEQSAGSGDRLAFGSYAAFAGAEAGPYTSQYVASREEGAGWSTHPISPPQGKSIVFNALVRGDTEFQAFSPDLCTGWFASFAEVPGVPAAPEGFVDVYRRADNECGGPGYAPLNTARPPVLEGEDFHLQLQGVSADGGTAVLLTDDQLAEGGSPANLALKDAGALARQIYVSGGAGQRFACVLPGGGDWAGTCTAGGSRVGTFFLSTLGRNRAANLTGALSENGSRLFWTALPSNGGGPGAIYLRENPAQPQSALTHGGARGSGKLTATSTAVTALVTAKGKASIVENSPIATLTEAPSVGEFVAGQPLNTTTGIPSGTTVVSCSPECGSGAKTLTLSNAATATKGPATPVTLTSKGPMPFAVGQTIGAPGIPPGTTIAAVKEGELTLSDAATVSKSNVPLEAFSECTEAKRACTIAVSAGAEEEAGSTGSQFEAASEDGSRVLFSTGGTFGDSPGTSLYEYRPDDHDHSTHLIASRVLGMVGQSGDLSRVYLASEAVLSGANNEGHSPVDGKANLYLYETATEQFRFIDVLAREQGGFSPLAQEPMVHLARVSGDGLHAAFVSSAEMTGYDNADAASEEADAEVYLYDATADGGEGRLMCASCNPSGARPRGVQYGINAGSIRAAALIPPYENSLYASRVLSEDGKRLFFESYDQLVPRDTNGVKDVYEWEEEAAGTCAESSPSFSPVNTGCVHLISSGKSERESSFVDASPSGRDVFFRTLSSLLPQDNGLVDIYDARENGGLPAPPAPPAACEGEACQSAPGAPNDPTPASSSFEGAGNVKEEPRPTASRCTKGKVKRRGRCIAKKHNRAHGKQKRTKSNGRAAR